MLGGNLLRYHYGLLFSEVVRPMFEARHGCFDFHNSVQLFSQLTISTVEMRYESFDFWHKDVNL